MVRGLLDRPKQLYDKPCPVFYDALRRIAATQMRKERDAWTLQSMILAREAYMRLVELATEKKV